MEVNFFCSSFAEKWDSMRSVSKTLAHTDSLHLYHSYDNASGALVRYLCARVVVCSGASDRASTLAGHVARHALHSLATLERAAHVLGEYGEGRQKF